MSTTQTVRIEGLSDTLAAIRAYPLEFQKRPIRSALAKAARQLRNAIRAAAPVRTGRLAGAVFSARERNPESFGLGELFAIGVRPGKKRNDKRGAYYWRMVEFGTAKMPALPFVRPTFASAAPGMLSGIQNDLRAAVPAIARRVAKAGR